MSLGVKFCVLLALLAILGAVLGCKDDERKPEAPATGQPPAVGQPPPASLPPVEQPKPGKDGKVDPIEQAKADALRYRELAAQAEARYETMVKQRDEEQLRSQAMWISGIAMLVAALAGIAAFLVPVGKKTLVTVAIGCVVIAACAQAFRAAVPYLPWIGGAALAGAGIWVAVNWRKLGQTVQTAADHGDRLERWLVEDVLPGLDDTMRAKALSVIEDVKIESKAQAQRLGTHGTLQFLRGKSQSLVQRVFNRAA